MLQVKPLEQYPNEYGQGTGRQHDGDHRPFGHGTPQHQHRRQDQQQVKVIQTLQRGHDLGDFFRRGYAADGAGVPGNQIHHRG
ncbi:hypothetical protein D3C78_1363240 [compost metagenome]